MSLLHKEFCLNGVSFTSVEALLSYVRDLDKEVYEFLEQWFNKRLVIEVKTSGSTGIPKVIAIKKEHMKNSAMATAAFFKTYENTTALLCLSANYIAGKMMLVRAFTLGWKLDIVSVDSEPLKDVSKEYDFCAMVPLQLEKSLEKLAYIKTLIVGGGVVSQKLQKKIATVSTQIYATYGMTETVTHIALKKLNYTITETVYKVLPGIVITKDSRGCLVISAPSISDEKVVTNDLVEIIDVDHFKWLGRFDTIINSGGIKLVPEQLEEKIAKKITSRFFISSLPDEKLGEKIILLVEASQRKTLKEKKEILEYLSGVSLLKYEFPKRVYFLPKFIETATNKIQRKQTLELVFKG